jgi:predicted nucleic acid-binding protein
VILVDTSIWINHLWSNNPDLASFLENGLVFTHPSVVGELACGSLKNREAFLKHLRTLPFAKVARDEEVTQFVEQRKIWGRGVGWIDAHLLASSILTGCRLWTFDWRLYRVAAELGLTAGRAPRDRDQMLPSV